MDEEMKPCVEETSPNVTEDPMCVLKCAIRGAKGLLVASKTSLKSVDR